MTALRTFPLRTAPRPGESLDSWLEAAAVRLRVTMAELYEAMGFASPHSELWRHIVLRPTDTELAAISATTGLTPGQVRAMTLSRYAGIAVGIDSDTGDSHRLRRGVVFTDLDSARIACEPPVVRGNCNGG